jgi:hypothetical protein
MYLLQLLQGHNMEIEGRPVTVSRALARIPNDRRPADRYDDRRDDHRYATGDFVSCCRALYSRLAAQRVCMRTRWWWLCSCCDQQDTCAEYFSPKACTLRAFLSNQE